jgi:hypothetical protein
MSTRVTALSSKRSYKQWSKAEHRQLVNAFIETGGDLAQAT